MHHISLTAPDGFEFPVYVGQPARSAVVAPLGAVVVLQEIFGVNAHVRAVADRFAAQGYVALAPALFQRVQADVELGYTQDDANQGISIRGKVVALPEPGVQQDIQATIAHAAAMSGGKVAVVGSCWGGLLAWRAAALLDGVGAAVPYYGGGMTVGDELGRQARCPVLAHFGEADKGIPMDTVEAFRAAQQNRQPPVQVEVYPGAGHGFSCDERAAYQAEAAALAFQRTLEFLKKTL